MITRLQNTRMARGSDDWPANEGQEPQCIREHARSLNSQAVIEAHTVTSARTQHDVQQHVVVFSFDHTN